MSNSQPQPLLAGTMQTLLVAREKSPFGFFLSNGEADVLLHYTQLVGPIEVGTSIEVFLYHDSDDRLAATMHKPLLLAGQIGRLRVVDRHAKLGCFLDIGLDRHVLLPRSELPELEMLHPQLDDQIYVLLTHDKQGRLLAKTAKERELAPLASAIPNSWQNQWLEGIVYNPLKIGSFVIVEHELFPFGGIGMIHESDRIRPLRLGERVQVRVTFIREDGRANFSLRAQKEQALDKDAEAIIQVMRERGGSMPYSDESPADAIVQKFGMSKSAFKRALGRLMKAGLIRQDRSWTYLEDKEGGV
jgi:predicted RNA-binding protein (virulence factor B family)